MKTPFQIFSNVSVSKYYGVANKKPHIGVFYGNCFSFKERGPELIHFLGFEEIERMNRFVSECDRLSYLTVHALLKRQLVHELQIIFEELKVQFFSHKKPFIDGHVFDFNLSHSANMFSFIIADNPGLMVGVDIEMVRSLKDIKTISLNYFTDSEHDYIFKCDLNEQLWRFYEIWTSKEAFVKMIGTGLFVDLKEVTVTPGKHVCHIDLSTDKVFQRDVFIYTHRFSNFIISVSLSEIKHVEFIELIT